LCVGIIGVLEDGTKEWLAVVDGYRLPGKDKEWLFTFYDFPAQHGGFLSWFTPCITRSVEHFCLPLSWLNFRHSCLKIADFTAVAFELSAFFFLLTGRTAIPRLVSLYDVWPARVARFLRRCDCH
jgi:hypothetical protein